VIRRLLRTLFVLALLGGAIAAAVTVGRKLMGGLGPEPGSAAAPQERPSLVPSPAPETGDPSGNGASSAPATADT
jgi:hypothetical protein